MTSSTVAWCSGCETFHDSPVLLPIPSCQKSELIGNLYSKTVTFIRSSISIHMSLHDAFVMDYFFLAVGGVGRLEPFFAAHPKTK